MAKTYTALTSIATGDVLTATNYNNLQTNSNNFRVPPICIVRRTSNLTSYTQGSAISWSDALIDTESPSDPMWASGSPTIITIRTAGLYHCQLNVSITATATVTRVVGGILKGGTQVAYGDSGVTTTGAYASVSTVLSLAVGDTIAGNAAIVGGSAYIVDGTASLAATQSRLAVTWLSQVS